jgi:hypothetical protein
MFAHGRGWCDRVNGDHFVYFMGDERNRLVAINSDNRSFHRLRLRSAILRAASGAAIVVYVFNFKGLGLMNIE